MSQPLRLPTAPGVPPTVLGTSQVAYSDIRERLGTQVGLITINGLVY